MPLLVSFIYLEEQFIWNDLFQEMKQITCLSGINNSNILLCVCSCQQTHLASCFSASAQSSNNPMSTADTSIYGSQTVKPRPIRSMAVRRMVLWGGSLGLGGCSSRKVNALPAKSGKSRNSVKYNSVRGRGWLKTAEVRCYFKEVEPWKTQQCISSDLISTNFTISFFPFCFRDE